MDLLERGALAAMGTRFEIIVAGEPGSHARASIEAALAEIDLSETLLALQPFAVEARYRDGEFPLPARRELILSDLNELVRAFLDAAECAKDQDR